MALRRLILPLAMFGALAACDGRNDGALELAIIDSSDNLFADGVRLSSGAQHVRAATSQGLVALDARGDVIPALADRWIVTDDGRSFIFRLRDGDGPDGRPMTAETMRAALLQAIRALDGTSLGLDLAPIEEVRAMAGRVIEIRLSSPVPMLLQLLAQPELATGPAAEEDGGAGNGPMTMQREGDRAIFVMKPPTERGIPEEEGWERYVRPVVVRPLDARRAIAAFDDGAINVVLGGNLGSLPLANIGPLSRGTVRIDAAVGLFGLHVRHSSGFLAEPASREAIAMAIDRIALVAPFSIGGWEATTRVVQPGMPEDRGAIGERWEGEGIADRRLEAANRVAAWRLANGMEDEPVSLTILLGDEPGHDLLLRELAGQLARIGIVLERVGDGAEPDLLLVDRVARYASPSWFLNQFNCSLRRGLCSEEADLLVTQAVSAAEAPVREAYLAEAEAQLTLANVYIPFGSPVRWSLVRGNVSGFAANPWAFHPLPPLATLPR